MEKKYTYVISDGDTLTYTCQKPENVRIAEGRWYIRTFDLAIGEAISPYTDGLWVDTIGVYDLSVLEHVQKMVRHAKEHTLRLGAESLKQYLRQVFGAPAASNALGYGLARGSNEQRDYPWTPLGRAYFNAQEIVHRVYFRAT